MRMQHPMIEKRIRAFKERGWWGETTINDVLADAVQAHPERLALADQPNKPEAVLHTPVTRLTWRELDAEVAAYAQALQDQGVGPADVVVAQLPNVTELVVLLLAVARVGAVISPVPVQYGRHELGLLQEQLQPALFVGATRSGQHDLTGHVLGVPFNRQVWLGPDTPKGDADWALLVAAAKQAGRTVNTPVHNDADAVYTVCWTSGTTGTPKGVPRTHNQWQAIAKATYEAAEMTAGDILLNPFPFVNMASIGGFLFNWLRCQGSLVLHHPLDLPVFLTQLQQEQVSFTIAPPALLNMLLKNEDLLSKFDLSSLRCIASGSAPLSPWMVRGFAEQHDIGVVNLFGSNEGVSLVSSLADIPDPEQRASYFPRFGVSGLSWQSSIDEMIETRLRDLETGEIITEPGQPGELEVYGATLFDHYLGQQPDEPTVFTDDGFFRTGDLFEIAAGTGEQTTSEPPYYRFVGRSKDIIIRGGFNISPDELDMALAAHPQLAEAATVGAPCEEMGERICVFAVPKEDAKPTLDSIREHLKAAGFASFKLPERLEVIDALPRNPLGKVVRQELREQL